MKFIHNWTVCVVRRAGMKFNVFYTRLDSVCGFIVEWTASDIRCGSFFSSSVTNLSVNEIIMCKQPCKNGIFQVAT